LLTDVTLAIVVTWKDGEGMVVVVVEEEEEEDEEEEGGGRSRRKERGGREGEEEDEDDNGKRRRRWRRQGVVTLIYAVVTALTRLLTPYTKEGVESLCTLLYIIGSRAKCVCGPMVNE